MTRLQHFQSEERILLRSLLARATMPYSILPQTQNNHQHIITKK
jgi:hypothetical protein